MTPSRPRQPEALSRKEQRILDTRPIWRSAAEIARFAGLWFPYPAVFFLERRGLLDSKWDEAVSCYPRPRLYNITDAGLALVSALLQHTEGGEMK